LVLFATAVVVCEEILDRSTLPLESYPIKAVSNLGPRGQPLFDGAEKVADAGCYGTVTFEQASADECKISWDITGYGTGNKGFHVHEKANISSGCTSASPHFNLFGKTHGAPTDDERHAGDLGYITSYEIGNNSKGEMVDRLIKLDGNTSVIGRSVVVHADEDDLGKGDNSEPGVNGKTSKTTGNAGARIACGEITRVVHHQQSPSPPSAGAAVSSSASSTSTFSIVVISIIIMTSLHGNVLSIGA